jgi:hypothetical protein
MSPEDLRGAEEVVLRQFGGAPLQVSALLARFQGQSFPPELLRRAVWTLVEKGELEITQDLSVRKRVAA